jgi:general secretion pathway protein K
MRRRRRKHARQRGVALVIVLFLTVLLTVVGGVLAFSMRSEALAARNAVSLSLARIAADGGVERTVYELTRPRTTAAWKANGLPHRWKDGDVELLAVAVDESAKIDLNAGNAALLKGVFMTIGGLDDAAASAIVDAIADWRDGDDLRRPGGAESGDYRAANSNYTPANANFETVAELSRVLGVTPMLYARVFGVFTVHSRQPGINAQVASRQVLLSLPNATEELVNDYLQRREAALEENLPVPPFPPAQAFPAGGSPAWRIRVEAQADGVTFVREAVVRVAADPRRPFYALLWAEGERSPPPTAPASAVASPAKASSNDGRRS